MTSNVSTQLDDDDYKFVTEYARNQDRTLSAQARRIIHQWVEFERQRQGQAQIQAYSQNSSGIFPAVTDAPDDNEIPS